MNGSKTRYIGHIRQDMRMPIIVNTQNILQFYLALACPRPGYLTEPYVTCYATSLEEYGFEDDIGRPDRERQECLYDWLEDRLLTFQIKRRGNYFTAWDVAVHELNEKAGFWEYEPVPLLTARMAGGSLEAALASGAPLHGLVVPERSPDMPLVAVAEQWFIGPFEKVLVNGASVGLKAGPDGLGRVPAVADGAEIIADDGVWFVERTRFRQLVQKLRDAASQPEPVAEAAIRAVAASVLAPATPAAPASATTDAPVTPAAAAATGTAAAASVHPGTPSPASRAQRSPAQEMTEEQFIHRLIAHARDEGLYFLEEDLISFHTALKTSSLVVLAGLSGTGKSRLVEVYRQALGLSERSHFLWLSVRPSWNDDADLIGYYDPLNRLYRPGEAGLVDLLVSAARNPGELFMVCLDEMNLARVEHYFSQFLSNIERSPGQRQIRLYAPELQGEVYNCHRYPPFVRIGRNVLFCGTINVDESTHSFSDKVLDRSTVIRMEHVDLERWWQQYCGLEAAQGDAPAEEGSSPAPVQAMVTATTWYGWRRPFDPAPYGPVVALLQGLNALLREVGADRQFGYRVARQILNYLHQVPRRADGSPFIQLADALDQQICQRILTKVRGTGAELRDLFRPGGKLEAYLSGSDLGSFPRSLAEINRKYAELERHDFTS